MAHGTGTEGTDPIIGQLLEATRRDRPPEVPSIDYDTDHDLWTVFFRSGRHTAIVVDEYMTVFEDDEQRIIGVQLSNLRKIKDCLGPEVVHWDESRGVSLIRLVLRTFNLLPDGVEHESREKLYFKTATELAEVKDIRIQQLA